MTLSQRILAFALILFSSTCIAQSIEIYPPHWWVGMKTDTIQLLVKSNDPEFSDSNFSINNPNVVLKKTHTFQNKKYVALDIAINKDATPGNISIQIKKGKKNKSAAWTLKAREGVVGKDFAQGVTSKDFMYLVLPDRFSNGDVNNDKISLMRDQTLNRDSLYHRHGGDLQGILNHLDYFEQLGVTALWLMPVLENDRTERTEHGYAFTNHYKIDPRLGDASIYKKLSQALHTRNMKLVQDAVYNHVDIDHILFKEKPDENWFHQWPKFTQTSYKDQPLYDPYASTADRKLTQEGWFTQLMPDWNHNNPHVAKYLIQHAIWCVEEFGVDGWRIDTYLYNDLQFMNSCNAALIAEYPSISIFGELWVHGVPSQAYFVENNVSSNQFKSNLQGATDFQTVFYGIIPALTQPFGWTEGVNRLYTTLSYDYLYKDPSRNVIFLDNHDINRFFSVIGEDVAKQKIGLQWLLTSRGIPQMYYGTEVLMKGFTNPDGWVRLDFPGGWSGDKKNSFSGSGLTPQEKEVQDLVKSLATFRKSSSALSAGKMMQYVPQNGLYVYFRYDEKQTVMCIMNTHDKPLEVNFSNYEERTKAFAKATEVVTKQEFNLSDKLSIPSFQMFILLLDK
jgi:neopullulanase